MVVSHLLENSFILKNLLLVTVDLFDHSLTHAKLNLELPLLGRHRCRHRIPRREVGEKVDS